MKSKYTYQESEKELSRLRESNVKSFLDLGGTMFVAIDTKGIVTYVNKKACELLGYKENEIVGKNWFENFLPERIKKEVLPVLHKLLLGEIETSEYYENPVLTKGGKEKIIYWHNAFIKDESGNIIGSLSSGEDITERKKIEQSLIESELRWKFAVEGNNDGLWDWNLITNEVFFSTQWKNMLGYSENEISGNIEEWDKRIHPDDKKEVRESINKHFKGETEIYENEYRLLCKDNTYKWILDRGKIISYTKDNNPERMIGTHSDISERKIAEQALIKSEKELKELNATKDKFFSIIAHDLKSPFNSMLGFTEILDKHFDNFSNNKQKEFISNIYRGMKKTYKLLENLLYWSLSKIGTLDFNPKEKNLYKLTNEIIETIDFSSSEKSITISNKIPENSIVIADGNMISFVIRNLISNAIKFTPRNGNVVVKAERVIDKKDIIIVSVKDSGIGISPEIQSKLFKITENISTKGTEEEKGTGLGLILCKEFIEKHGGKIWIESELGIGTIFNFTIPGSIQVVAKT